MTYFKNISSKIRGKAILLFVSASIFSCSDFLEVASREQVSDVALWETTGNADLFLNNVYSGLPDSYSQFDPFENFSDNAMNGVNGVVSRTLYFNSSYTPSNAPSYWDQYANIRKCNVFITNVEASKLDDTWKKLRLSEARFVRAYYYMLLLMYHGGVPIITDVLNQNSQGEAIFRARNTAAETAKFIIDECGAIADNLPKAAEAGRASKGAALTLKGWCELFQASPLYNSTNDKTKWKAAAETNKKVIDLAAYTLFPNYETMLLEDNNNNAEVIFSKQFLGGTALGSSKEGLQGAWVVGGVQRAYGGVDPTQNLVDEYQMANGLSITDPASGYDPKNPYVNREKRFYQTIIYDGSSWLGYEMIMRQGVGSRNATDLSNTNESTNTGYYLKKGMNPKFAVNGDNKLSSANFVLFRFAEVLLSYAEAQNEAVGPDESVYDAINKVRARSELPALKKGLTQEEMRTAIYRERRVELAFEEKRWPDLMRLKLAEKNLNGILKGIRIDKDGDKWNYTVIPAPAGDRTFYANKNYVLPIPQSAIDRNPKLVQNPNY